MDSNTLLEIKGLSISFNMYKKGFKRIKYHAINDLSLQLNYGEVLAIVGSSGSGKSLLAHSIMGLLPKNADVGGKIFYHGKELTKRSIEKLRGSNIALIPQSMTYLDPLMKVGRQVRGSDRGEESKKRQRLSFNKYDLCEKTEKLYPYQLSGGMARRALISTAAQKDGDLIIADEPTPGLDLHLALKTLKYFRDFADEGKGVLIITHDIDLALNVADKIAVFYGGTILEVASVRDFQLGVKALRHPYTQALYKALPQNGCRPIKGYQPYGEDLPKGCIFSPRCENARESCKTKKIEMREVRDGFVRCDYA